MSLLAESVSGYLENASCCGAGQLPPARHGRYFDHAPHYESHGKLYDQGRSDPCRSSGQQI